MAITSLFRRMLFVSADMSRTSFPASNGDRSMDHIVMCVLYSLSLMPPLPISSMSGSFQCPTVAYGAILSWLNPIFDMDFQLSEISPVVRQELPPTFAPQFQTSSRPYWHKLNTIGRCVACNASPIT